MFFRSERLFLRPGWPEDWADLHRAIAEEAIVRNLASAPWPYAPEDAQGFTARTQDKRHPHFLVTLPGASGTDLIGCIGLAEHEGESELGYWIAQPHWNRGFATEAGRAVLALARTLGHRRVVASHFMDNPASGRVLRKLGFRPTGEIRQRHSQGRGTASAAVIHALTLADACGCDGDGSGGGNVGGDKPRFMRAA